MFIDFETRSKTPVDLRKSSAWLYAEHPTTEVLCLGVKTDAETPARLWVPLSLHAQYPILATAMENQGIPAIDIKEVYHHIENDGLLHAHNAEFERAMWTYHMSEQPRLTQWRCTAAMAAARCLPRSLGMAAQVMDLLKQKDSEGHDLMLKMCKPLPSGNWSDNIGDFIRLFRYCLQDVEAEFDLYQKLKPLSDYEQAIWFLDQEINERGAHIDAEGVLHTIHALDLLKARYTEELRSLTHGVVSSGTQSLAMLNWIKSRGVDMVDVTKASVAQYLEADIPADVKRVLILRSHLSKTSTSKYQAMLDQRCEDGRVKSLFMYHGSSTGRWAGKGIQVHNLPRGSVKWEEVEPLLDMIDRRDIGALVNKYPDPMEALSSCVRARITAAPGNTLLCADYSAIEGRVLAWLAGEDRILDDYRAGKDPYKVVAAAILGKPYESITPAERSRPGKVAELACGYQGSVGAARNFGAEGTDEEILNSIVRPWRKNRALTVKLWYGIEQAAIMAVLNPGRMTEYRVIKYAVVDDVLYCRLPSGRLLSYNSPRIESGKSWNGSATARLTYTGVGANYKWGQQETYGGRLVENITQAVARDILAGGMLALRACSFDIVMHVHDEIVVEAEDKDAASKLKEMIHLMTLTPDWAEGLPLEAVGWTGKRYRKD